MFKAIWIWVFGCPAVAANPAAVPPIVAVAALPAHKKAALGILLGGLVILALPIVGIVMMVKSSCSAPASPVADVAQATVVSHAADHTSSTLVTTVEDKATRMKAEGKEKDQLLIYATGRSAQDMAEGLSGKKPTPPSKAKPATPPPPVPPKPVARRGLVGWNSRVSYGNTAYTPDDHRLPHSGPVFYPQGYEGAKCAIIGVWDYDARYYTVGPVADPFTKGIERCRQILF